MDEFIDDVREYGKYCDLYEENFLLVDALMRHFVYELDLISAFMVVLEKEVECLTDISEYQEVINLSNTKYEEKIIGCSALL